MRDSEEWRHFRQGFVDNFGIRFWELVERTPLVRDLLIKCVRRQSFTEVQFFCEDSIFMGYFMWDTRAIRLNTNKRCSVGEMVAVFAHEMVHSLQQPPTTLSGLIALEEEAYILEYRVLCQLPQSSLKVRQKKWWKSPWAYQKYGAQVAKDNAEWITYIRGQEEFCSVPYEDCRELVNV